MDRSKRLVYDVGVDDLQEVIFIGGKTPKFYQTWKGMLERCYSSKYQKKFTTYVGCYVCDEWKYLSNFKTWFDANYVEGFELDKDILVKGNKVYSADTCRFIPKYINYLKPDSNACIRELNSNNQPNRKRISYQARVALDKKSITKVFDTMEDAKLWYISTKKDVLKKKATQAFLNNEIKSDIYLALVRR